MFFLQKVRELQELIAKPGIYAARRHSAKLLAQHEKKFGKKTIEIK